MSRSAEITLPFGGEDRIFRLSIGRLRALQEKCDAGPQELLDRYVMRTWRVDDLREPIFHGLIGGGMDQSGATRLVMSGFDDQPLQQFVTTAQLIVMAALVGAGDEDLGEPKGEDTTKSPSPDEKSASATSTASPPSSVTVRVKSTN